MKFCLNADCRKYSTFYAWNVERLESSDSKLSTKCQLQNAILVHSGYMAKSDEMKIFIHLHIYIGFKLTIYGLDTGSMVKEFLVSFPDILMEISECADFFENKIIIQLYVGKLAFVYKNSVRSKRHNSHFSKAQAELINHAWQQRLKKAFRKCPCPPI